MTTNEEPTADASSADVRKPVKTERFLYVIGSGQPGQPVKIGVAANVQNRLRMLQTGSPAPLKALFSIELTPDIVRKAESACHRLLHESRLAGEWFQSDPEKAVEVVNDVIANRLWENLDTSRVRRFASGTVALYIRVPKKLDDKIEAASIVSFTTKAEWVRRVIVAALEREDEARRKKVA